MIFKGDKTFFLRSISWIVFLINLSLSPFFEAKGQDEVFLEKYKIEKSKENEIIWKKYKIEKSKEDSIKLEAVKKPRAWRNRIFRFSFEEIDMPDEGENMGLYGISAFERFNPWLYGGITAYDAATGRRGGFFTGGYTLCME